jgi:hypothetical protein
MPYAFRSSRRVNAPRPTPADSVPEARALLLAASPNGRYLVDGNGNPFFCWGESSWLLGVQIGVAAQNAYLDARVADGLNSIVLMTYTVYQNNDPADADGVLPFTTPGDLSTFNPVFFAKIYNLIERCAELGIVVFLSPAWAGYNESQGLHDELVSEGTTKCFNYGATYGAFFEPLDNIVHIMGGDKPGVFDDSVYKSMTDGIKSVDTRHLVTSHWNFQPTDAHPYESWEDIAGCYDWAGGTVYAQVITEYAENDAPCIVLEAGYELNTDFGFTRKLLRIQSVASFLAGAKGFFWGHEGVWHYGSTSPNLGEQSQGAPYDLDSDGWHDYCFTQALFVSLAWHLLIPDTGTTLITSGRGDVGTLGYITCSRLADNTLAVLYDYEGGASFTVDLTQMAGSGNVTARWFDPTNGQFTNATGSPIAQASGHVFTTPGNNASGESDWLLVLTT